MQIEYHLKGALLFFRPKDHVLVSIITIYENDGLTLINI